MITYGNAREWFAKFLGLTKEQVKILIQSNQRF